MIIYCHSSKLIYDICVSVSMCPLVSILIGEALAEAVLRSSCCRGELLASTLAMLSFLMSRVIFLCWSRIVSVQYT